jgi:hypothetical protein
MKKQFLELHSAYVAALSQRQAVLAREADKNIQKLLTTEFYDIAWANIGINPGTYFHGYEELVIDTQYITDVRRANLYEKYRSPFE